MKKRTRKAAARKKAKKKTPGKKAATRRSRPKKKPAKKAAAKKRPPKKKPAKKAPAKKRASSKKAPAKKPPAKPKAGAADQGKSNNVVDIHRFTELSISQISLDTGFTRATVNKRLAESAVQPTRTVRGYPVYRLKHVLDCLFTHSDGVQDPDKLKPFERRAFYQGELDKLKFQTECGELVPSFEVESQFSRLFKILTQRLDTLPDIIERDVGVTARQLIRIEELLDDAREEMYREVTKDDVSDTTAENSA